MPRLVRIAAVLAVLACSTPGIAPAQGPAIVRIATQSPLSGPGPGGEAIRLGAQLAIEQLGRPLGQMGFRVELLSFDDQGKPDVGVANARSIVADREIVAVIGHLDARVAVPASEIYRERTLAMIAPAGTGTLLTDRNLGTVSRICGRDDVQGTVAAGFAAGTLMAKSAYVLHDGTTAAQDVADLFRVEAERRGLRIVGFEGTAERAEFDPIIAPVKARSPDLVFFAGRYDQVAPFWRRAREQGVRARLLGPDSLDSPAFARLAGGAAAGVYYTSPVGPPAALPGARPFLEDFQRPVRAGPGPPCRGGLRRHGGRAQGDRGRRPQRRSQPRGRRRGRPQDEGAGRHRRDRVRRQRGSKEGALLRVAGRRRGSRPVGPEPGGQAGARPAPALIRAAIRAPGPGPPRGTSPGRRAGRPSP